MRKRFNLVLVTTVVQGVWNGYFTFKIRITYSAFIFDMSCPCFLLDFSISISRFRSSASLSRRRCFNLSCILRERCRR